jgi:hypothetical protein
MPTSQMHFFAKKKKSNALTSSVKGVVITPGAMQLVLILSRAHSHAKLLESWFIAPA